MNGSSAARDTAARSRGRSLAALCSFMLCAGGVACAPETITVRSYPNFAPSTIDRAAVVPFRASKATQGAVKRFSLALPDSDDAGDRRSSRTSVPQAPRLPGVSSVSVPPFAPEAVRHMVYSRLRLNPRLQVVPPDAVGRALQDADAETGAEQAKILGQRLDVDAVIEGMVRVYREREGTAFAAVPAAVGFELRLRDAGDGEVLWMGEYFEEQKPLTEDARGFFARGGSFVSAEELARDGVVRMLRRLSLGKE